MIILSAVVVDTVIISKRLRIEFNLAILIKVLQRRRTNRIAEFRGYAVALSEK